MNIFSEVKKLNFPLGHYVVVGSGHLIALGLKEGTDIDIVVTEKIYNQCINDGWEVLNWTYPGTEGQTYLRNGIIELYLNVSCEDSPTSLELIENATHINNIPFVNLNDLLKLKKEYSKLKDKHLGDIQLIEDYLKK